MSNDISNTDDVIDVRQVIDRFEELQSEREAWLKANSASFLGVDETDPRITARWAMACPDEADELGTLSRLLEECRGSGGDHEWDGAWFPITLIRDSYFRDYAEELAEDVCSYHAQDVSWPLNCIDWDRAARELQTDYTAIDFDGQTYWTR